MSNGLYKSQLTIGTSFLISDISLAGEYKCGFIFDGGSTTYDSAGQLIIRIVTASPASPVISYNSDTLAITCTLHNSDTATNKTVKWTHGNSQINLGTSESGNDYILTLTDPTASDNGQYKCKFEYDDGNSPEGTFTSVTINTIEMSPEIIYTTYGVGVTVTLSCEVASSEEVSLLFKVSGSPINGTTASFAIDKTTLTHEILMSADAADLVYSCHRESSIDQAKGTTTIKVVDMTAKLSEKTRGNEDSTQTLTCTAEYNSDLTPPTIQWSKNDSVVTGVDTPGLADFKSTLDVNITSKDDGVTYKCAVKYTGIVGGDYESTTEIVMNSKLFILLLAKVHCRVSRFSE